MRKRTFKKIIVLLMIFCMTAVYMPVFSFAEELPPTQEVEEVQTPAEVTPEPSAETPPETAPAAKEASETTPEVPKPSSEKKEEKKVTAKSAQAEELNTRNYDGDPDTELENPTGKKDLDWDKLLAMKEEKAKQDKARKHNMHT